MEICCPRALIFYGVLIMKFVPSSATGDNKDQMDP